MEAKMHKKLTFLLLAFILCVSFLNAHPVAAATQNSTKTMIIVDTRWDTGQNPFDPTVWLYTESYVIEVNSGRHLDHQNLRYELYNPDGVLCEVQNHKTGTAWYNLQREICAKADFEGPFKFKYLNGKIIHWNLKVIYNGTDQYDPCEKTISFSHDNYDYPWGGSD
jgi:hypothetical protein